MEAHRGDHDLLDYCTFRVKAASNDQPNVWVNTAGALKMQDRKMTDKDIAGGGKCRTGI